MKIRTRYAPSPTGKMHVGNLRTALYAYLVAKHEKDGKFLLRIEDTDRERYVEGALDIIYDTLKDTGLYHDEGPDIGGEYGPYIQSERVEKGIYLEYAKKLIEKKEAYYCFSTKEEEQDENYNPKVWLNLTKEEVEEKLNLGMPYTIRQNNPKEGSTKFYDVIYGEVEVDNKELDDMVLIKSDGYPTYNFANVIDDHLMEITHVVRGNEYISSTPKYNRLYEALGFDIPVYIHCPTITDENHKKLSKRLGHSSYQDLIDKGFLSEAIINFVALLGWSDKDGREILSLEELKEVFDYKRINKSPAVFDMVKLRWMNAQYIEKMSDNDYLDRAKKELGSCLERYDETLKDKILLLAKTRIETFKDIVDMISFFDKLDDYDINIYIHKKMKTNLENSKEILEKIIPFIKEIDDFTNQNIYSKLVDFAKENGYKNGMVLWPVRIAISGRENTPAGASEIMEILGKEETIKRLESSMNLL